MFKECFECFFIIQYVINCIVDHLTIVVLPPSHLVEEEEQPRHKRPAMKPPEFLSLLEAHVLCLSFNHEQSIYKIYYLSHALVTDVGVDKLVAFMQSF